MKSVILLRHGKSDWNASFINDHERPLALRGIKAAKKMGKYLSKNEGSPDILISSTALRAKETIELAKKSGKWNAHLMYNNKIYGGPPRTILKIIQKIDEKFNSVCLIGHEPNFSSFISKSTNGRGYEFPTAAMACIYFDIKFWKDIRFGNGILKWLARPKEIEI